MKTTKNRFNSITILFQILEKHNQMLIPKEITQVLKDKLTLKIFRLYKLNKIRKNLYIKIIEIIN